MVNLCALVDSGQHLFVFLLKSYDCWMVITFFFLYRGRSGVFVAAISKGALSNLGNSRSLVIIGHFFRSQVPKLANMYLVESDGDWN